MGSMRCDELNWNNANVDGPENILAFDSIKLKPPSMPSPQKMKQSFGIHGLKVRQNAQGQEESYFFDKPL
jgi:hypothetical protein